jgi:hypothetical protein
MSRDASITSKREHHARVRRDRESTADRNLSEIARGTELFPGVLPAEVHRSDNDDHEDNCSAFPDGV